MAKCKNYSESSLDFQKQIIGAYRLYVTPVIGIIGIFSNFVVILIFLLEHKKSRFSIYCVAISGTHVIILLTNSLMDDFMGSGFEYWKSGFQIKFDTQSLTMCKLMEYVPNCMYTASSGLLLVFSIDRIVTIFKPMQFYSIHFRKFAIYICLSVVILSSFITIPMLMASYLIPLRKGLKKCTIDADSILGKASVFIKVFVTFVIPTFIILILNIVICLKLWRAKIQRLRLLPGDFQKNNMEMNRICGHLALNTVFLLFTFPLVVAMLMRQVNACSEYNKNLSKIFSSVKDISYSLDFLLYFVFLTNFRWRFIKYLIAPLLCCGYIRRSCFGIYIEMKLIKHESNSSRRKYSAIAAALTSCNNQNVFSVLMYGPNEQPMPMKPLDDQCNSYNSGDICPTPALLPSENQRCISGSQKSVSYALNTNHNKRKTILE